MHRQQQGRLVRPTAAGQLSAAGRIVVRCLTLLLCWLPAGRLVTT